jgi:hypothetical protein
MYFFFFKLSKFGHVKFTTNEKYSKIIYENPNYYASLVIFQIYKNAISLGWLFLLCFYQFEMLGLKLQK